MKSIESNAPVLIITLNRYEHFKRCIESLRNCDSVSDTHLFIALDYPPSEKYVEGFLKIKMFIRNISGFKKITIIERNRNYGAYNNLVSAINSVLEEYDNIIITEDDNEFSYDFLSFLNLGLAKYKNDKSVLSICAYSYPVDMSGFSGDVYFYNGFSGWGHAIWKDKYEDLKWDLDELERFINDKENKRKISSNVLMKNLKKMVHNKVILGDAYICYHQIKYNMVSVFPVVSRVRNHGHDGTGVNCGNSSMANEIYSKQVIYDGVNSCYFPSEIHYDPCINSHINKSLNPNRFLFYLKNPSIFFSKIKNHIF